MRLPNLLEHETVDEVIEQAAPWIPLHRLNCHPDTQVRFKRRSKTQVYSITSFFGTLRAIILCSIAQPHIFIIAYWANVATFLSDMKVCKCECNSIAADKGSDLKVVCVGRPRGGSKHLEECQVTKAYPPIEGTLPAWLQAVNMGYFKCHNTWVIILKHAFAHFLNSCLFSSDFERFIIDKGDNQNNWY